MRLLDPAFSKYKWNYVFQPFLAAFSIFVIVIFSENVLKSNLIIASIGATAFIIFVVPHYRLGKTRLIMGGYIISIIIGLISYYIFYLTSHFWLEHNVLKAVFSSFSVGIAIFLMVILDCEHPPAAGVALDILINKWNYPSFFYLLVSVSFMLFVKRLLKKWLINLV
jgi:CBS-domain-containing membrane protein